PISRPVPVNSEPFEILHGGAHPWRVRLDAFMSSARTADGTVRQVPDGPIGKSETRDQIVLPNRFSGLAWERERRHGDRLGLEQPIHQIDEVARLADDRTARA